MEMPNVKEAFARILVLSAAFAAFSTRGEPVPVMFDVKGSKHHAAATKALAGAEAPGDDFRIVRTRPGKGETAWRVRSKRMALPPGTVAVAFEFEICTDSDWRPVTWDSATWDTRIVWFDSDGNSVKGKPWWDALGVEREAEKLELRFKPGSYARFRVTRDVPDRAAFVEIAFGRDMPDLGENEQIAVRGTKVDFVGEGRTRPSEISPDLNGPSVRIAFTSPTGDESVEVKYVVDDPSGIDWSSLSVTTLEEKPMAFRREGNAVVVDPGRRWGKGDHRFRISVNDLAGNTTRLMKAFRVGDRPDVPGTSLRADGALLVGGKAMFPVGLFCLCPREANLYNLERCFADVNAAGVNLAHSYTHYRVPEFQAGCARHGMVSFQKMYWSPDEIAWFGRSARKDPTIGLWYVGDDTCLHYSPETIANRVEMLEALDGTRLSCHADVFTPRFGEYADLVDVFMPEIYPIHAERDAPSCVARTIDIMEKSMAIIKSAKSGKVRAVWPIIQYFKGWRDWHVMPKPNEVYAMSFASIIHGGMGITWYTYGGFIEPKKNRINYGVCSSAQSWNATTNLTRRISALAPVLLAKTVEGGPAPKILSGPAHDEFGRTSVTKLCKELDGDTYVLAVNATTNDVVARIKAGAAAPGKGIVMHEERNVKIDGEGFFEDAFGPFAVHIYRIPAARKE